MPLIAHPTILGEDMSLTKIAEKINSRQPVVADVLVVVYFDKVIPANKNVTR